MDLNHINLSPSLIAGFYKNHLIESTGTETLVTTVPGTVAKKEFQYLGKNQKGICLICQDTLFNEEELHVHHKKPRAKGGKSTYDNLILVHFFCHQQLHAKDKS